MGGALTGGFVRPARGRTSITCGCVSDVLQEAMELLGVGTDAAPRLNVCELGVLLGLRRAHVRDHLLEGAAIGDAAQLRALLELFLEKTQDAGRLLQRLQQCDTQGTCRGVAHNTLPRLVPVAQGLPLLAPPSSPQEVLCWTPPPSQPPSEPAFSGSFQPAKPMLRLALMKIAANRLF